MANQSVDIPDAIGVENLVFEENNTERSSWKFCNSTTLPRSEVVFLSSVHTYDTDCDNSPPVTFL